MSVTVRAGATWVTCFANETARAFEATCRMGGAASGGATVAQSESGLVCDRGSAAFSHQSGGTWSAGTQFVRLTDAGGRLRLGAGVEVWVSPAEDVFEFSSAGQTVRIELTSVDGGQATAVRVASADPRSAAAPYIADLSIPRVPVTVRGRQVYPCRPPEQQQDAQRPEAAPAGAPSSARDTRAVDCTVRGPSADLRGCDLAAEDLGGANLINANLEGVNLDGANLEGAQLTGANLAGANLTGASMSRANLVRANLTGADLTGAQLTGADVLGANLHGVTWSSTTCPNGRTQDTPCQ